RGGSLVVPEDRGPQRPLVLAEGDESVHLSREADADGLDPEPCERRLRRAPPVLRVLLGPARLRRRELVDLLCPREHLPVGRDRDRLDARRADVEADERAAGHSPQNSAATRTSVSTHSSVCARSTHSTAACAPVPPGPKSTVGMPAAARTAESAQYG